MSSREYPEEDYDFAVERLEDGGYEVSLPHQCDDWKIIGWDYNEQKSKEIAISQMELFIKRAQEALEILKAI